MITLWIFFRKLCRLHVPVCRNECDKAGKVNWCGKTDNGFMCTRLKGHKGLHSACGSSTGGATEQHDLHTWEN